MADHGTGARREPSRLARRLLHRNCETGPDSACAFANQVRTSHSLSRRRPQARSNFLFARGRRDGTSRSGEAVNQWENPPILIYKDEPPQQYAHDFDGFYAWVHVSHRTPPDPHDWGKEY